MTDKPFLKFMTMVLGYPIKIFILFSESMNVHQPLSVTAGMVLPVSDSD